MSVGYTNNPKYFSKKQENPIENENFKQKSFKKKNKFKNRKRPKNFSFKKHKRK